MDSYEARMAGIALGIAIVYYWDDITKFFGG